MRTWRAVVVASMASVLLACPHKPPSSEAPEAAASATAVPEAAPPALAANEAKVTRYQDEAPMKGAAGVVVWAAAHVRTQMGNGGDLIVTVRRATSVEKIAKRQGYELVVFDNPADASSKLMGWINAAVFTPEPPHAPPSTHCPGEQVAILVAGGGEACVPSVSECKSDAQCPAGWVCDGEGMKSKAGQPDKLIQFCRVGVRLPGVASADAGAQHSIAVPADAGAQKAPAHK